VRLTQVIKAVPQMTDHKQDATSNKQWGTTLTSTPTPTPTPIPFSISTTTLLHLKIYDFLTAHIIV